MLASLGKILAYLFIPSWGGHYSWGLTVSAIQGLVAKEQVVSSLAVIAGEDILSLNGPFAFLADGSFGAPWIALSFLSFNLFSIPCVSAVSAMRRELGSTRKLLAAMGIELAWAYLISTFFGVIGWGINGFNGVIGL